MSNFGRYEELDQAHRLRTYRKLTVVMRFKRYYIRNRVGNSLAMARCRMFCNLQRAQQVEVNVYLRLFVVLWLMLFSVRHLSIPCNAHKASFCSESLDAINTPTIQIYFIICGLYQSYPRIFQGDQCLLPTAWPWGWVLPRVVNKQPCPLSAAVAGSIAVSFITYSYATWIFAIAHTSSSSSLTLWAGTIIPPL